MKELFDLVVVGVSSGGLHALGTVLGALPPSFPLPVAVVQHRRPDSGSQLLEILAGLCPLAVREPVDHDPLEPGTVFLAPADYHLLVEDGTFALSVDPPESYARPSIDVLFESAAQAYGRRLVGVLLTAGSEDGALGMAAIAAAGGLTIVEDPETAFNPTAPRAALARTRVHYVRPLEEVGPLLRNLARTRSGSLAHRLSAAAG